MRGAPGRIPELASLQFKYSDLCFYAPLHNANYFDLKSIASGSGIFLNELKVQRHSETLDQLVSRALLTINARHLLDPANPPFTFLFITAVYSLIIKCPLNLSHIFIIYHILRSITSFQLFN